MWQRRHTSDMIDTLDSESVVMPRESTSFSILRVEMPRR
jgi:hypothetical protein